MTYNQHPLPKADQELVAESKIPQRVVDQIMRLGEIEIPEEDQFIVQECFPRITLPFAAFDGGNTTYSLIFDYSEPDAVRVYGEIHPQRMRYIPDEGLTNREALGYLLQTFKGVADQIGEPDPVTYIEDGIGLMVDRVITRYQFGILSEEEKLNYLREKMSNFGTVGQVLELFTPIALYRMLMLQPEEWSDNDNDNSKIIFSNSRIIKHAAYNLREPFDRVIDEIFPLLLNVGGSVENEDHRFRHKARVWCVKLMRSLLVERISQMIGEPIEIIGKSIIRNWDPPLKEWPERPNKIHALYNRIRGNKPLSEIRDVIRSNDAQLTEKSLDLFASGRFQDLNASLEKGEKDFELRRLLLAYAMLGYLLPQEDGRDWEPTIMLGKLYKCPQRILVQNQVILDPAALRYKD